MKQVAEQTVFSLQSQLEAAEQQMADEMQAHVDTNKIATDLQNQLGAAEQFASSLQTKLGAAEQTASSLQAQLKAAQQQVASKRQAHEGANKAVADRQTQTGAAKQFASSLQTKLGAAEQTASSLQAQLEAAQSQLDHKSSKSRFLQEVNTEYCAQCYAAACQKSSYPTTRRDFDCP